jgi:hypothetical protein
MDLTWNILENSRDTLQHFSLFADVYTHSRLWSMHFPSLRILKFCSWIFDPGDLRYMSPFILSHSNTLEVLYFSRYRFPVEYEIDPHVSSFSRDRKQIPVLEHQPHLISFSGSTTIFLQLLDSGLKTMFTRLETLELDNYYMRYVNAVIYRNDGFQRLCTFFTLRRLCLTLTEPACLPEDRLERLATGWLTSLQILIDKCQATLEVLLLNFSFTVGAKRLAGILGQVDSLNTIHLSRHVTSEYENEQYIKILSSHCKGLRKVWIFSGSCSIYPYELSKWNVSSFQIERDSFGGVIDIQVVENP